MDRLVEFFERWLNVRSESCDLYSGGSISCGMVILSRSGVDSRGISFLSVLSVAVLSVRLVLSVFGGSDRVLRDSADLHLRCFLGSRMLN